MADGPASTQSQPRQLLSAWSLGVFLTWTVTSFLCHHFAKSFLGEYEAAGDNRQESDFSLGDLKKGALAASILTAVQIALCHTLIHVGMPEGWGLAVTRLCHVTATWFTNLSMACMFASSTFAIKLMEPITSAVIQFAVLGTPLSPLAILSLPVIVGGAIAFSGNPLTQSNLPFGIAAAFMSNIILAFRNVALKMGRSDKTGSGISLRQITPMYLACTGIGLGSLALCWVTGLFPADMLRVGALAMASAVFHVLYSFVSTGIVLAHLSVVSHAVTNILKRVLVVLLLYVSGTRSASLTNFLGLGVCTLGLFIYAWSKRDAQAQSLPTHDGQSRAQTVARARMVLLVIITLLTGFALGLAKDFVIQPKGDQLAAPMVNNFAQPVSTFMETKLAAPVAASAEAQFVQVAAPVLSDTFSQLAHRKRSHKELLPKLDGYLASEAASIDEFLKEDLLKNPNKSSFLSKKLRSNTEIINEAQRLHFDIIGGLLKDFKYAMLMDIAAFENKGDPCITVGETYYLARTKLEVLYYCNAQKCSEKNIKKAAEKAKKYSPKELVVLVHGGGNIVGYAASDIHRFKILYEFKGYQVMVFPQSVWVPHDNYKSDHFKHCIENYCCNENLTFVMRDHLSYDIAKKNFGTGATRFILAPDMAFQIGPVQRFISPTFDIMWIKRGDGETPGYTKIPSPPPGIRVHVSDWWKWITPAAPTTLEKAHYICSNGFFYLQRGRVIITDRLHGHILATLMNIPHVLIDNKAHKLSSYHLSWTAGLENTVLTDDPAKAMDLAMELLRKYEYTLPPRVPFLHLNEDHGPNYDFANPNPSFT